MASTKCPTCDASLDLATHPGSRTPKPGDIAICMTCGNPMVFADDMLTLRHPTTKERRALARNSKVRAVETIRREVVKRSRH